MTKTPSLTIRLDRSVRDALDELARKEDRSISYIINRILAEHLESQTLWDSAAETAKRKPK